MVVLDGFNELLFHKTCLGSENVIPLELKRAMSTYLLRANLSVATKFALLLECLYPLPQIVTQCSGLLNNIV